MSPIFLVNRQDYILAKSVMGQGIVHATLITNSVETYNLLETEGIAKAHFVDVIPLAAGSLATCHHEADRIARAFDANLSELRTRHLRLDVSSLGWDYLNVYFIVLTALRWKHFAPRLVEALPEQEAISFFYLRNEQDYYFDSSVQRQFLLKALQSGKFKNVKAFFTENRTPFVRHAMDFDLDLTGDVSASYEALVHMPTVYYDYEYHRTRLAGLHGPRLLDVCSPYFDIPIGANRITLRAAQNGPAPASLAEKNYAREVRDSTHALYEMICPDAEVIPAQVERQLSRSLSQLHVFNKLCSAPQFANIGNLYISDHDAGLSGPLSTWANLNDIETEIHPHSSLSTSPFPVMRRGLKHGYVRAPGSYTELGVGSSKWTGPLVVGSPRTDVAPLVLLIMNALTDPGGVPTCEFSTITQFVFEVIDVCRELGIACKVRSKSSWDFSLILARELRSRGIDEATLATLFAEGPLSDWVELTSICIGVDQISTALSKFLARGVSCIQAFDRGYAEAELHSLPSEGVFTANYEGALKKLREIAHANKLLQESRCGDFE